MKLLVKHYNQKDNLEYKEINFSTAKLVQQPYSADCFYIAFNSGCEEVFQIGKIGKSSASRGTLEDSSISPKKFLEGIMNHYVGKEKYLDLTGETELGFDYIED